MSGDMEATAGKARASRPERDPTWSVRAMPAAERDDAINASKRADMSIGEWLGLAVRTRLAFERDDGENSSLAMGDNLVELERLVDIAAKMAAATGKPVPRTISRMVYRELRTRLMLVVPPVMVSDKTSDTPAVAQIVGPDESGSQRRTGRDGAHPLG